MTVAEQLEPSRPSVVGSPTDNLALVIGVGDPAARDVLTRAAARRDLTLRFVDDPADVRTALCSEVRTQLVLVGGASTSGSPEGWARCSAIRAMDAGRSWVILGVQDTEDLEGADGWLGAGADDVLAISAGADAIAIRLAVAQRTAMRHASDHRAIWNAAPVAITVHRRDDGRFLDANERFLASVGMSRAQVLGRDAVELGFWPSDQAFDQTPGSPRSTQPPASLRKRYRDNRGEAREITMAFVAISFDGIDAVIAASVDTTDRLRAEESLREQRDTLRALYASAPFAMGVVEMRGDDFVIVSMNSISVDRIGQDGVPGRTLLELGVPPDLVRAAAPYAHEALARRTTVRFEVPSAVGRWAQITFSPLQDSQSDRLCYISEDVTERRAMQSHVMLADRMAVVGSLASGVAHEINNPLAFVTANVDFALEQLASDAPDHRAIREGLLDAQHGAERVRLIVRELSTFSRTDQGEPRPVDVLRVLEAAVRMASSEIRRRARLQRELRPTPNVRGHEARVGQLILSMLLHAARALPDGRPDLHAITVRTGTDADGSALIEVEDTGPPLAPGATTRVFDPFTPARGATMPGGLGMAISLQIVTELGGRLTAEPGSERGLVVRARLPAV